MNEKQDKLASILVNHSLKVEPNEKVLIIMETLQSKDLVLSLINYIYKNKGIPFVKIIDTEINSKIYENLDEDAIDIIVKNKFFEVDNYDSFITIRYEVNNYLENKINNKMYESLKNKSVEVDNIRINKRKWVLLNYPSVLDAYKAKMNNLEYEEFAYNAMIVDYDKMYNDLIPLKELMSNTDKVRIVGDNTDITFSIKNMSCIICAGENNIPDGEVFTAPVKESVNGYITYNVPAFYQGNVYYNIKLIFRDGKIVDACCDNDDGKLSTIFDIDEGARYIGEFSIGVNSNIMHPIGNILYDEKIYGSIHLTPGRCYQDAFNGNISAIHWDLVRIGREDYGRDEIYFDDVLIRKNGDFVYEKLKSLNKK